MIINIYLLTLNLAPLVPDESIVALDINRLLILKEEWPKSFILNLIIKDIIWEILEYILINISFKKEKL